MENINIKPPILILLVVFIIIVIFGIYKYIDTKMKTKLQRHKKKLKKYYETQFNQMFYNTPTTVENKQNITFEDQEPDGYDSNSSSSIKSDHADVTENQKILEDDYKNNNDNGKMMRGRTF